MKDTQETMLEFRRDEEETDYPVARGVIIFQYGGSLEECVKKARAEFNLGSEWKVIKFEDAEI